VRQLHHAKSSSLALLLPLLVAVGCGSSAESAESEASEGGESASYEGPIASTDAEAGKDKFEIFCSDCHGDGGDAPDLTAEAHTPAQLRQQIREGSGKMRPIPEKRLSAEDMESVLAYLATINAVK
jgi:mono/diheme cytochrome c family protein